jgi:hypothetical protein
MSAFLVSQNHINAIVSFAAAHCGPTDIAMAAVLTAENVRSLAYRYSDIGEERALASSYVFEPVNLASLVEGKRKPAVAAIATQIVKACDCFDYQACETPDYETTQAARFVAMVRNRALAMGGKGKGTLYEAARWEVA